MKKIIFVTCLLLCIQSLYSQVLISLLFGDKLNSPKIEFGLEGGANFSTISNLEPAQNSTNFNLGFYFDFKLKNYAWAINTGVIVKSSLGADQLPVYSLGNETLDNSFIGGHIDRKISYFSVPIMLKYKFENNIYIKAGTQLGLLNRAYDEFKNDFNGNDLEYKNKIRDKIHPIDAGLAFGTGYRLMKGSGINLGVYYYHGLVAIMRGNDNPRQYHRSLYLTVGIPIGKAKSGNKN